ncbi:MAG: hypothetical protein D3906_08615 [Candidatus Electrothrix sp. AUS1_2]|nr:hypothetical protein [Candidatus Electrothrix sp. AUS1_2]
MLEFVKVKGRKKIRNAFMESFLEKRGRFLNGKIEEIAERAGGHLRCGCRIVIIRALYPNGRCRMHGGGSPGAPAGNTNALKHGLYSCSAIK